MGRLPDGSKVHRELQSVGLEAFILLSYWCSARENINLEHRIK